MSRFHKVSYTVPFLKCVETFGCTTIPVIMNPNLLRSLSYFFITHYGALTDHGFSKKDNTLAGACTVIFKILAYFLQFQQYMSTHAFSNLLQSNIMQILHV